MTREMQAYTTLMLAKRLAAMQPLPERYYARQIRTWVQLELLQPSARRGRGRTAAAEFQEHHLFEAQILNVLTEVGLSPQLLAQAMRVLRQPSLGLTIPDDRPKSRAGVGMRVSHGFIKDAIQGVRDGEKWVFQLCIIRDEYGRTRITGAPVWCRSEHILETGPAVIASIPLSMNALFAPLLN